MTQRRDHRPATNRRTLLIAAAGLAAAPALARAAQPVPKASAKYQDHPNGESKCDVCAYWVPGDKPDAPGACKVVAGPVAPDGWCVLFAPKGI